MQLIRRMVPVALLFTAQAHANLLVNGSFEQGALVPNASGYAVLAVGDTSITGWTIAHAPVAWAGSPNTVAVSASEGSRFLDLTADSQNPEFRAWMQQTVSTAVGGVYQLSFDLGSSAQYGLPVFILASAAANVPAQTFTSTSTGLNVWQHEVMQFTAVDTSTTIMLAGAQGASYIGLDNVSLDVISLPPPVPEPAAWGLWLSGLLLIGLRLRSTVRP